MRLDSELEETLRIEALKAQRAARLHQAPAPGGGGEVVLEFTEGEILIDHLGQVVTGMYLQRQVCDDAECAEAHDSSGEAIAIFLARQCVDGAVRGDELHRTNGGSEISVAHSGPTGYSAAGSANRDVR
jgi:hypothetical protein